MEDVTFPVIINIISSSFLLYYIIIKTSISVFQFFFIIIINNITNGRNDPLYTIIWLILAIY